MIRIEVLGGILYYGTSKGKDSPVGNPKEAHRYCFRLLYYLGLERCSSTRIAQRFQVHRTKHGNPTYSAHSGQVPDEAACSKTVQAWALGSQHSSRSLHTRESRVEGQKGLKYSRRKWLLRR